MRTENDVKMPDSRRQGHGGPQRPAPELEPLARVEPAAQEHLVGVASLVSEFEPEEHGSQGPLGLGAESVPRLVVEAVGDRFIKDKLRGSLEDATHVLERHPRPGGCLRMRDARASWGAVRR